MADCSYARCLQERRNIKRELQRWTKNMVYVVGLERVAEELMGRRKWKLYQDVLLARNLPLPQPSDDSDALSDSATQNQIQHQEDEEQNTHMIATAEAIQQRHAGAAELAPLDNQQEPQPQQQQHPSSPIALDEDSKEADITDQPIKEENTQQHQEENAPPPAVLKIKTIEEINTDGVEGSNCKKDETILESLIKRSSTGPPSRRPMPVDWTPQDKCHFCEDGELVRPTQPEVAPEHPPSPAGSESGSSSSRSVTSPPRNQLLAHQQALAHILQLQQQQVAGGLQINQMESMAAQLAAVAAIAGGGLHPGLLCPSTPFLHPWYNNVHQRPSTTPERVNMDSEKATVGSSLSSPSATELPLDLSSKGSGSNCQDTETKALGSSTSTLENKYLGIASPSSLENRLGLRGPPIDPKQIYKTKQKLTTPTGRRAYSDAELQAALRDIQSGRLGTRRAAVLYNIPRSTLRNKVYKLERERESRLPGTTSGIERDDSNDIGDDIDDDKDSIMDEEKEEEKEPPRPMLSMEDILRFSQMDSRSENLKALLQKGGQKFYDLPSDLWSGFDSNLLGPYIQSLLMSTHLPKPDDPTGSMIPDIARQLVDRQNILKECLMKQDHLNNGKQNEQQDDDMSNKRSFSRQSSSASSVITKNERSTPGQKTDSPDEIPMDTSEQEAGTESRDSPNVILRIPSFKPLANAPNSNKNGGETFPGPATPPLSFFNRSPHGDQTLNVGSRGTEHVSPPLGHPKNMYSLRDVIARSISQKFQQPLPPTSNHNDLSQMKMGNQTADAMEGLNTFKRGGLTPPGGTQGISVIRNPASHDLAKNFTNNNSNSNQPQQSNTSGGKGTRPKRGKYRNYDRDSLVEAVKAVQRGEMSVHRAGSYYGVPHSTLEYKVKERHLMRPRKREPKNPNPDDKTAMPSVSKPTDIPGSGTMRIDKSKVIQKPPAKPTFAASSPNGLKIPPIFDPAVALGYNSPFPFWSPTHTFPGLPVEFPPRNPGASGSFSPNAESFIASQMMQRLQEESARHPGLTAGIQKSGVPGSLFKTGNIADLYEGVSGSNGSFLEGIIRSSLDQSSQRTRTSVGEDNTEGNARRLRPDDLLLAEEMREAARRVRARESGGTPSAPSTTPTTPAPEPMASSPPQTS